MKLLIFLTKMLSVINANKQVLDVPPILTLQSEDGKDGLYVNMLYNIGRANGELNLRTPVDLKQDNRLYVDVGLEFGTNLVCNLFEDESAALLGFEAHPINFGLAYHNLLRHPGRWIINDRLLVLPMGKFVFVSTIKDSSLSVSH
jgi:hypothetical protein